MNVYWHSTFALLVASPLFACGGASRVTPGGVPVDAGPGTVVPWEDAGPALDAAPLVDATPPPPDAAPVPVGPGLLLFAGWGEAPLNDTWNWDGSKWTDVGASGTGPSVRSGQSMIGLGQSDVLLFGGQGLGPYLGDTWRWNGLGWTQVSVAGPSAREGGSMALLNGKVILYGGSGSGSPNSSDTWEWDGTQWTQLTITGPTPGGRFGHSMVTLGNEIVLFGGVGGPTDTWTFDGTSWKQAAISSKGPTGQPGGLFESRGFQTMATFNGKVILFGGEQDANHILNDTWEWNGTSWTQLTVANPPPARFHAGMETYDGKVVLFGGAGAIPNGPGFLGDTWTWDGTTWTQMATTGNAPSARYGYVLAAH